MPRPPPFAFLALGLAACLPAPPENGAPIGQPIVAGGVVLYTSPDAVTWTRVPGTVHGAMQSLGLSVRPNGDLWVSALDFGRRATIWERYVAGPPARGLVFDGEDWREEAWGIDDDETPNFIDPQWLGDELWYVSRQGRDGDPAIDGATNRIRSSPPARDRFVRPHVTDPSPVIFQGALHVFLTAEGRQVEQWSGEPLVKVGQWPGVTVPFATVVGEELWLLVQMTIQGKRHPAVAKSRDGRRYSSFAPMIPPDSVDNCTSPVMGPHPKGGFVLLCTEERDR